MEEADWFIGEEAQERRGKLSLQYPISRATVTNWDSMEKVGCASGGVGPAHGAPCCPGTWEGVSCWHPGLPRRQLMVPVDTTSRY